MGIYESQHLKKKLNIISLRQLVGHAQPVAPAQLTAVIQELRLELQRPVEALALGRQS